MWVNYVSHDYTKSKAKSEKTSDKLMEEKIILRWPLLIWDTYRENEWMIIISSGNVNISNNTHFVNSYWKTYLI